MNIFSFGERSFKLLFPLLTGICHVLSIFGEKLLAPKDKEKDEPPLGNNPFFFGWVMFLSESLIIFFYFLEKKQTNTFNNIIIVRKHQKCDLISFALIALCFFIDFSCNIMALIISSDETLDCLDLILNLVTIVSMSIFSTLILHYNYYRHHFVGGFIVFIGILIYSIFSFLQKGWKINPKNYLLLGLTILSSLLDVIEKYLMDFKYLSPYLIIATEGLIGIIIIPLLFLFINTFICTSFISICNVSQEPVNELINAINGLFIRTEYIIGIILFIIGVFFFNLFGMLTTKAYSPTHRSISDTITSLIIWILTSHIFKNYLKSEEEKFDTIIVKSISYIVIFFGLLIFLEIIIIDVFDLNRNTTKYINKRIEEENNNSIMKLLTESESEEGESFDDNVLKN